jgi:hypothetical protein
VLEGGGLPRFLADLGSFFPFTTGGSSRMAGTLLLTGRGAVTVEIVDTLLATFTPFFPNKESAITFTLGLLFSLRAASNTV